MSDREIVIAGFVLLLVTALGAVAFTHIRRDLVATVGETIAYLIRTRAARIAAVLVWAWLGWHFLAR
jgi:cell division protein FtsL